MHDDTLVNKAASIERCVARAKAEYARDPDTFARISRARTRRF